MGVAHSAALGIRPASVVPGRVRLGPGMYVHREGTRAGPEPPGWQRLLPSRGLLGGGRVPESHRPDLGAASRPLGCEETEFCIRVSQHRPDWTFVFEPQAVIWHRVPAERERFSYFRSRCFAEGLSKAAVTRSVGVADGLSAERRYTTRTLTRGMARGLGDALRGDRAGIERSCAISVGLLAAAAGYARGGVSRRTEAK